MEYFFTSKYFSIRWYSILIMLGIFLAIIFTINEARKFNLSKDFIINIAFWIIVGGIICARIYYVIFSWNEYKSNPIDIFKIWEGGLAIHGGLLGGFLMMWLYCKKYKVRLIRFLDIICPYVLLAQAIGRWGNFFNQEVYGQTVSSSAWWLPSFVQNQMVIGGSYKAPLYFLEGVINLGGFILLGRVIPTLMGKHYKHGDVTFAYFVFYGIVRVVLEPVRDSQFNMGGEDNMRAVYMAIAYVGGGLLLILINHLIRFKLEKDPDFFKRMIKSKK